MIDNSDKGTQGETGEQTPEVLEVSKDTVIVAERGEDALNEALTVSEEVTTLVGEQLNEPVDRFSSEVDELKTETDSLVEELDNLQQDASVTETEIEPFLSKVKERKETIRKNVEEIKNFLDVSEMEAPEPRSDITVEEVVAQIKELENNMDITPMEYMLKSGTLLKAIERARGQNEEEYNKTKVEQDNLLSMISEISNKKEKLEEVKGLWQRIKAVSEKKRLAKKEEELNFEYSNVTAVLKEKKNIEGGLLNSVPEIKEMRNKLLYSEVKRRIDTVVSEYEKLGEDMLQDGTIPGEIIDAYIEEVIVPCTEKVAVEKEVSEQNKNDFYRSLRSFLHNRSDSEIYGKDLYVPEESLSNFAELISDINLQHNLYGILRTSNEQIMSSFVTDMALAELLPMKERVNLLLQTDIYNNEMFEKYAKRTKSLEPSEIMLWNAIKFSKTANSLFGDYIHQKDSEVYEAVIKNSKRYGDTNDYIKLFYYYPTPDAIKSLVLLATGEGVYYVRGEIRFTLDLLKQKPNWGQLLDVAEGVYPSLKPARELLESGVGSLTTSYIRSAANDLLLEVIEDENVSGDDRQRAVHFLKQEVSVVNVLAKRGIINEQEQNSIAQAITFLNDIPSNMIDEPGLKDSVFDINDSDMKDNLSKNEFASEFCVNLREHLALLSAEQSGSVDPQKLEVIRRFSTIANLILENKTDINAIKYLTSDSVLNKSADLAISSSDLLVLLSAYKAVPSLSENYDLCSSFCSYFKGEESVIFLKDLSANFSNQTFLTGLYKLVGEEKVSPDFALKLHEKLSKDIVESQSNKVLLQFPELFLQTDKGVEFFKSLFVTYYEEKVLLGKIANLVNNKDITQERALELPVLFGSDGIKTQEFQDVLRYPKFFLKTNEGLLLSQHMIQRHQFSIEQKEDINIGREINISRSSNKGEFKRVLPLLVKQHLININNILENKEVDELKEMVWHSLLMAFTRADFDDYYLPKFSDTATKKIKEVFEDPKVRDTALNGLKEQWLTYLESGLETGRLEDIPFSLLLTSEFIHYCEGAGPLSQVTSLNSLIVSVNNAFSKETTVDRTKVEIAQGLLEIEQRFNNEKWSNNERTDFYNISRDIIDVAPSIFSDNLTLFKEFSPSELEGFVSNIYPLHRAKLAIEEKRGNGDEKIYSKEVLMGMRTDIRNFTEMFKSGEVTFEEERQRLLTEIRGLVKERFGIIKISERITPEHIQSFSNVAMYLSTMRNKTPDKEKILGFYLAMMVNDKWGDFREGKDINPHEYLIPENSAYIKTVLQERKKLNPLTAENLGIQPEEIPLFMQLLQTEVSNMELANITTVDQKLTNIIKNLEELTDEDLYPTPLDRERIKLLQGYMERNVEDKEGGKKKSFGSIVSKIWMQMNNKPLRESLTIEEERIREEVFRIMEENNIQKTPEELNRVFQKELKPFSAVISLAETVKGVEGDIEVLESLLQPESAVIEIFNKLGEDFTQTSGAIALSQDIDHLENLVVKKEDKLKPEEKEIVDTYLSKIREQVIKLEEKYNEVQQKINSQIDNVIEVTDNEQLKNKLNEIKVNVNRGDKEQVITSVATNNLNVVIKNIRECLSCMTDGINNDTNLTFGDSNKFFLFTQEGSRKERSISDQIVFVVPIDKVDGSNSIAFVFDRVYGTRSRKILENHIKTILKKQKIIKQQFPNIKLGVFISGAAMSSVGTSAKVLLESFNKNNMSGQAETVTVSITESATGDQYVEFHDFARISGERKMEVSGLLLDV